MAERRTWGASEQKIVAARQSWKCACCAQLLPASFEVDHVKPLWAGGVDCYETNAQALCSTCHAQKTQRENIERQRQLWVARQKAILAAREASPLEPPKSPKAKPVPITSPQYVDPMLNNPFLKYAYVPTGGYLYRI